MKMALGLSDLIIISVTTLIEMEIHPSTDALIASSQTISTVGHGCNVTTKSTTWNDFFYFYCTVTADMQVMAVATFQKLFQFYALSHMTVLNLHQKLKARLDLNV